ncbi:hypothetical protein BJ138DRAFT_1118944 [Hygrophoropsis aurantiaca]|uniref:Uncharacterized protein n=1 Tax=Hygrophoropsis aurantiaca TaxID=72124 RepID=A0ACB7ZUT9_9AGAM|nr:hypothetical protein BJ138DRAFT_1118944 [Hygrophoropsis aurantiaca]
MDDCPLPSIAAVGNTCSTCRPIYDEIAQHRFQQISQRFFGDLADQLPMVLYRSKGAITGSTVQEVLSGPTGSPPRDLNIVVPKGYFLVMEDRMLRQYYKEYEEPEVNDMMDFNLQQFQAYKWDSRIVTVSESLGPDIMDIIVNSPTTTDMNLMTAGGVVSLFPRHTLAYDGLLGPTGGWDLKEGGRFGSVNGVRAAVQVDNRNTKEDCGPRCPSLWRFVRTDRNTLRLNWDRRYTVQDIIENSQMEWRVSIECLNPVCKYGVHKKLEGRSFTYSEMPATNYQIVNRQRDIAYRVPV